MGHVVITSPSRSGQLLERALQREGIQRRIVLRSPHYLSLPAIVQNTDLIATVPLAVAVRFSDANAVQLMALPFTPPLFDVKQYWHRRFQQDPRHRWLREQMANLFNETSDDWQKTERQLYGSQLRRQTRRSRP
jgi:DNA-binding transcriptional LysR family regulator